MIKKNQFIQFSVFLILLSFITSACSGGDESIETEIPKQSAESMYADAKALVENGQYDKSIKLFQEVERLYPFSNLAPRSQVMTAYAHYKNEDYDKSIAVINAFTAVNPGNSEIDFMYYLKATNYYDRISDVARDQQITENAKEAFQEVMRRFPNSDYARDAEYKIDLINDHLAGKEMEIGRYYLNDKKYIAAINRFKNVFDDYQETPQIEEALYRLVETNLSLGLDGEAKKYGSILGHNYSSSKWYKRAYNLLNNGGKKIDVPADKNDSGWFSGWFGDDEPEVRELHNSKSDANKIENLLNKEIENR